MFIFFLDLLLKVFFSICYEGTLNWFYRLQNNESIIQQLEEEKRTICDQACELKETIRVSVWCHTMDISFHKSFETD